MRRLNLYKLCVLLLVAVFQCPLVIVAKTGDEALFDSARVYVYDNPEKAIEIAEKLISTNENQPKKQIRALMILTNAYATKRNHQKSLDVALRAKEIAVKTKDPALEFKILIKLAAQYHSLGVNAKALQILDEADRLYNKVINRDSLHFDMGSNYAIRGFIYRSQLGCDIAIDYFDKAIAFYTTAFEDEWKKTLNKSVVLYNKGNCQIALNQLDSAFANFTSSRNLVSHIDAYTLRAFPMKGIAEVYTLEGKHEKAIQTLFDAEKIAGSAGDLELNAGIYKGLADNYLALHEWEHYLTYNRKNNETLQELKISERNTINNILGSYKTKITEDEKNLFWNFTALILGLGIILLLLVYAIISSQISFNRKFKAIKSKIEL